VHLRVSACVHACVHMVCVCMLKTRVAMFELGECIYAECHV